MEENDIQSRIYLVRGVQVMIDRDLALLYGVENRALRQAVRRNSEKFPDDFLLTLSDVESNNLITSGVSQTVIPSGYNTGGMQMYAFTEQGVSMLATVWRSWSATISSYTRRSRLSASMRSWTSALPQIFSTSAVLRTGRWRLDKIFTLKKASFTLQSVET